MTKWRSQLVKVSGHYGMKWSKRLVEQIKDASAMGSAATMSGRGRGGEASRGSAYVGAACSIPKQGNRGSVRLSMWLYRCRQR